MESGAAVLFLLIMSTGSRVHLLGHSYQAVLIDSRTHTPPIESNWMGLRPLTY